MGKYVLSLDRVGLRLESVQPFARFNTFDRVCLIASVHRAVARGGIGGVANPPNFCRINIFGKLGWPFGKLRQ
jgi:hypothetical protein